jgi:hypothetical protein
MTHTSAELCAELRRLGDAGPETITLVSELWATVPKTIVPLLQNLMDCGIVEGTRFRRDVWSRTDITKATAEVSYTPLLPNQLVEEQDRKLVERERERRRYLRRKMEQFRKKGGTKNDICCMAGV